MSATDQHPMTRSELVRRRHLRYRTAVAVGIVSIVAGCAGPPSADEVAVVPVTVAVEDATHASVPSPSSVPPSDDPGAGSTDVRAPEVWESRDLTRRTASVAAPPPAPTPVPQTTAPAPTPATTPPPASPPDPAPPELVVGEDGCVTDLTTGLVVTCHDPAAGPDDEPTAGPDEDPSLG